MASELLNSGEIMNRIILLSLVASSAVIAQAQSISSFNYVTQLNGLSTTLSSLTLTMVAGPAPTFMFGSSTYNITEVFGVWALDMNDDQSAAGNNQGGWNFHQNTAGSGGISGFKTNPNAGVLNQTKTFNFNTFAGTPENFGYHVRVSGSFPGGGNTLYIQSAPVPEPSSLAVIGLGLVGLMRRRARKA